MSITSREIREWLTENDLAYGKLYDRLHEAEGERDELRRERDALAVEHALIVKNVLAHLTTTRESPQWTTVDFDYMVKGIRLTLTQTDPAAILAEHDAGVQERTEQLAIAAVIGMLDNSHGLRTFEGLADAPALPGIIAAILKHDAGLVGPLVDQLAHLRNKMRVQHVEDKDEVDYPSFYLLSGSVSQERVAEIDAALASYQKPTGAEGKNSA